MGFDPLSWAGCFGVRLFSLEQGGVSQQPGTLAAFNNAVVPLAVLASLYVFGEIEDMSVSMKVRLAIGSILIILSVLSCNPSMKARPFLRTQIRGLS